MVRYVISLVLQFTLKAAGKKIGEFANSIDPEEVAHEEPSFLDLHCFHSSSSSQLDCSLYETFCEILET